MVDGWPPCKRVIKLYAVEVKWLTGHVGLEVVVALSGLGVNVRIRVKGLQVAQSEGIPFLEGGVEVNFVAEGSVVAIGMEEGLKLHPWDKLDRLG